MKFYKTILPIFCFILILAAGLDVQAEEWKSVIDSGDINYQMPEKKGYDSDTFVIHQGSNKEANSNDDNKPKKPLNIVFVRGYGAESNVADNSYQTKVKKIFKGHNVKFIAVENKDMTKSKVLENLEGADIFLINAHGRSKPFNGMQCLQVAPSEDNNNVLTITSILGDEKISLLTSLDIKKTLHGKKKPKLVIFNMCYGINPSDVPPKNLFSAAFGIDDKTQGRAFISWKDARYGFAMDSGILNHILSNKDKKWTVKDEKTGKYPKLKDVYSNKSSGAPFIIGDTNTRFITDEYFVLFQVTFPIVKKDRKIKKREEESKEEWKQRKKAYYQALGANDFTFQEIPLEKNQLIIKVVEDGMQYYSEDYFTENSEFTLKINGTTKTKEGERVPLKGALLLTRKGIYQSLEDLLDTYPFIQEKREKLNIPIFNRENGFARRTDKAGDKNHFTLGPINKYWVKKDKEEAVNLAKMVLMGLDCFIAHAVYDDPAAKQITVFRRFRDRVLKKSPAGTHLIRLYYEYGPEYAVKLRNNPKYIPYVRWCLDKFSNWFEQINLDSPEPHTELSSLINITDKIASIFFKEGESKGIGQIARIVTPQIRSWQEKPVYPVKQLKPQ